MENFVNHEGSLHANCRTSSENVTQEKFYARYRWKIVYAKYSSIKIAVLVFSDNDILNGNDYDED